MATRLCPSPPKAEIIDTLAYRLSTLADAARLPCRSIAEFERQTHEAECIASQLRAQYR